MLGVCHWWTDDRGASERSRTSWTVVWRRRTSWDAGRALCSVDRALRDVLSWAALPVTVCPPRRETLVFVGTPEGSDFQQVAFNISSTLFARPFAFSDWQIISASTVCRSAGSSASNYNQSKHNFKKGLSTISHCWLVTLGHSHRKDMTLKITWKKWVYIWVFLKTRK